MDYKELITVILALVIIYGVVLFYLFFTVLALGKSIKKISK